jgi:hypothetical protein
MRIQPGKKPEDTVKDTVLPTGEKGPRKKGRKQKDIAESISGNTTNVEPLIIPWVDVGPIVIEKSNKGANKKPPL